MFAVLTRSLSIVSLLSMAAGAQTIWYVDGSGMPPGSGSATDPFTSIQHAISRPATVNGDTVLVAPGTYVENLDFLGKLITVRGSAGASSTIVDGAGMNPVVRFVGGEGASAVLEDLTLRNGLGQSVPLGGQWYGGGVYAVSASPTLRRLVVQNCRASFGAGLYLQDSEARVESCWIRQNGYVNYGAGWPRGGGICSSGSIRVVDSLIELHQESYQGGGVYGSGEYVRCVIRQNTAVLGGGVLAVGNLQLYRCEITNNVAGSEGTPTDGGGLAGVLGTAVATECTIRGNSANYGGGALGATLVRCTLEGNSTTSVGSSYPARGGGAANCTLTDCLVRNNQCGSMTTLGLSGGHGGGLFGGSALRCRIEDNLAYSHGVSPGGLGGAGAFHAALVECDVRGNTVLGPPPSTSLAHGGGVLGGSATRCTIRQNTAPRGGGAADVQLVHCTLDGNIALQTGGSLLVTSGAFSVLNSIVRNGGANPIDAVGGALAITYSDVEGGYPGAGNFDADPQYVHAPSGDFHLLPGSPCVDAGDPAATLDPDGSRADVGAFALVPGWCGSVATECTGKLNSLLCIPEIGFSGYPSLSHADDFVVTARDVINQKSGLLIWGRAAATIPFQGGTLCVAPPLRRTLVQNSGGSALPARDCSGSFAYAFLHAYMAAQGIVAGDVIHAQYYSRDPSIGDGSGVSLSNALGFTVCP